MSRQDRQSAVTKHFDAHAEVWSEYYKGAHELSSRFLTRRRAIDGLLARVLGDSRAARGIDLGCGTGSYLPVVARYAERVVGIDVAPGMIRRARKVPSDSVGRPTLAVGSVLDLPLADASFDLAIAVGLLEYFDRPDLALREALRVLKPGAPLVFSLPHALGVSRVLGLPRTVTLLLPPKWRVRLGRVRDRLFGRTPDSSQYYLGEAYTRGRLRRLCDQVGATIIAMGVSGYELSHFGGVPVPARIAAAIGRTLEPLRDSVPARYVGNNLLVAVVKRSA
jgi:ubiquinone/menaquinone biosynthesis C-methylase UbiE